MLFCRLALPLVGIAIGLVGMVSAAEPPKPEPLPKPMVIPGEGQLRVDRTSIWQAYDVDRFGRFRPLVVNSPWGAYYYANGMCYPWTTTHPLEFKRVRVD